MRFLKLWIGFLMAALLMGCSTTHEMFGRRGVAPGAEGEVITSKDSYGNTEMKLKIKHLAPPDRIVPGTTNYIVWVQGSGQTQYQNVGGLVVNQDLSAEYVTRVPFENFQIMVTPEVGLNVATPSGVPVFERQIRR